MLTKKKLTPMEEVTILYEAQSDEENKNQSLLLGRKITRLLNNIENLTEKQASLKIEIRRQKNALQSRRNELKKVRSNTKIKATLKLEDVQDELDLQEQDPDKILKIAESFLLSESAAVLDRPD